MAAEVSAASRQRELKPSARSEHRHQTTTSARSASRSAQRAWESHGMEHHPKCACDPQTSDRCAQSGEKGRRTMDRTHHEQVRATDRAHTSQQGRRSSPQGHPRRQAAIWTKPRRCLSPQIQKPFCGGDYTVESAKSLRRVMPDIPVCMSVPARCLVPGRSGSRVWGRACGQECPHHTFCALDYTPTHPAQFVRCFVSLRVVLSEQYWAGRQRSLLQRLLRSSFQTKNRLQR